MQLDDLAKRTPQSAFSQTPYFDAVLWFFSVLKRKSRWQNLSSCVCGNTSTIGSVLSSFLASSKVWKSHDVGNPYTTLHEKAANTQENASQAK
jgi:hypothetical protein